MLPDPVASQTSEPFAIAIDVGGTNIRVARIARDGRVLSKRAVAGSRVRADALAIIDGLVEGMRDEGDAVAIAIGVPGRVDGRTGEVISGGYLDLSGVDLEAALARRFKLPVMVANDCSMALVGEARLGAGQGRRNLVMLTIGTGIGGAVLSDGRVLHGARHAGQLGHLVVNLDGRPCLCGQRGCVETESSGTSLRRHLDDAGYPSTARFNDVVHEADAGQPRALRVLQAWARPLQAAIGTLSAAFDPEAVILGGGMGHAAHHALRYLPPLQGWYEVEVLEAALGDDAGVIGAGLEGFQRTARPAEAGKSLLMINGVPASGKSSVARELSVRTGWPILSLDTLKNPFLARLDNVDRTFNRTLGAASYEAIFSVIADAPGGSTFIVDAWFGFQPREVLEGHIARAGITKVAEVWCDCSPEVVGQRYAERVGGRPPGHPGPSYVPELVELARRAAPTGLGPVKTVSTMQDLELDSLVRWVEPRLGLL